ncbi:MAG: aminopeptidase P family N-terminal domain-containing protein, partial [Chloroflexi bacterium]|nr:aminopeptidase P family N-terminal domain-containing protein [Chloroflexota bacterium]
MGFARGQFQVDYENRIDFERLRRERVQRTQRFMRDEKVDALLLWKDENVKYVSSLRAIMLQYRSTTQYGVLLFQDGPPVVFLSGGEYARAREAMPWIEEFVIIPIMEEPGLVETVVKGHIKPLLQSRGLAKGRIGLDGMTIVQWQAYQRHFPGAEFTDGETLMQRVRLIKLPDEIKILHEACALADAVTQSAIDAVYHGRRECEVAAEAMRTLFALGGEFAHLANPFVASGERMSPPSRFM